MEYPDKRPLDPTTKRAKRLLADCVDAANALLDHEATVGDLKIIRSVLQEMAAGFEMFAPYVDRHKITVFGSARTRPDHPDYRYAVEFGRRMADAGFMVISGGGPGIMEACLEGALRENSFGVGIALPFEQSVNAVIDGDSKVAMFKYFFTRKLFFLKEAEAVGLFPGGFGTQDEGFETLTLIQTGKAQPMPVVCIEAPGGTYWQTWQRYVETDLLRQGLISEQDLSLYKVTTDLDEAVHEVTSFYRVYNSSRWVSDRLVMRLNRKLPDAVLRELDTEFADILTAGRFEQRRAFAVERDDPHLWHLPRLAFHFDRHQFGRLRQLIDRINQIAEAPVRADEPPPAPATTEPHRRSTKRAS
jgi:hypothetical protein